MDVCNYFIHISQDVADVKFVNWTDIAFAQVKTVEAADRLSLSYHMFYGIDLSLLRRAHLPEEDRPAEDVARTF